MTVPNRFSRKLPLMLAEDISDILVYEILPKKETNNGAERIGSLTNCMDVRRSAMTHDLFALPDLWPESKKRSK